LKYKPTKYRNKKVRDRPWVRRPDGGGPSVRCWGLRTGCRTTPRVASGGGGSGPASAPRPKAASPSTRSLSPERGRRGRGRAGAPAAVGGARMAMTRHTHGHQSPRRPSGGVQTARCLGLSPGRRADWELRAPAPAAVEASRGPRAEFMDIADRAEGIPEESVCENGGTGARRATG